MATSSGVMVGLEACLDPGVTMLGFNKQPSKKMFWSYKALNTADKTLSVTFWQCSMEWVPSDKISGSTMGTKPFSWQMAAYLAKPQAFSCTAALEGHPVASSIFNTALHLANLQPKA